MMVSTQRYAQGLSPGAACTLTLQYHMRLRCHCNGMYLKVTRSLSSPVRSAQ